MTSRLHLLSLIGYAMTLTACIPKTEGGGGATSPEGTTDAAALTKCPADGVIDDGEDNNHQAAPNKGRGGYWFTFVDKNGSTVSPTAGAQGGTFSMAAGGANGSAFAARISGQLGNGALIFAGAGVNLVDPKGAHDLSAYKGIAFFARKAEGSTGTVRLKLPSADTDPDGKVCTECFNDFGSDIELTTTWTRYAIPFASMSQQTGWGSPRPASLDTAKIYGIQWQVNTPGQKYEIWIDDVELTGCQ